MHVDKTIMNHPPNHHFCSCYEPFPVMCGLWHFIHITMNYDNLVGGLEHLDYFSIQLGISWSQLRNSYFFGGVAQPPTRYDWDWLSHWSSNMMWLVSVHTHTPSYHHISGKWILYHPPVKEHRCGNPTGCRLFSSAYGFSTMFLYVYPSGTSRWDRLHSPVASRLLIYTVSQAEFLHFWHAKETMAMNANYNPITRRNPVGLGLWIP